MSDLIKRESVLLGKIPYDTELTEYQSGWNDACNAIANSAPSARLEIIHCENCKHRTVHEGGYEYCHAWLRETRLEWFCSRGEER